MKVIFEGDIEVFDSHYLLRLELLLRRVQVEIMCIVRTVQVLRAKTLCDHFIADRIFRLLDLIEVELLLLVGDFEFFRRCCGEVSRFFSALRQYFEVIETQIPRMN